MHKWINFLSVPATAIRIIKAVGPNKGKSAREVYEARGERKRELTKKFQEEQQLTISNNMRKILLTHMLISLFFIKNAMAQQDSLLGTFKNDSFKFTIIRISPKFIDSNRIEPSITIVESSISKRDKEKIENLKYSDWFKLLTNEKTDWATNLYLYEIYRRDASIFENVKDIKSWRFCCKKEDLDFWRKTLHQFTE